MDALDVSDLRSQGCMELIGQQRSAIFGPFALAHNQLALSEVQIFDPQAEALKQAQATAIEQTGHQVVRAGKRRKHRTSLLATQYGGQIGGTFRVRDRQILAQRLQQYFTIEEEQRTQGLVLGRSRNLTFHRKMGKKRAHFSGSKLTGMARAMKEDKATNPSNISIFGTQRILFATQCSPYLVEQFGGMAWFRHAQELSVDKNLS
jgi:hypothetical protein